MRCLEWVVRYSVQVVRYAVWVVRLTLTLTLTLIGEGLPTPWH